MPDESARAPDTPQQLLSDTRELTRRVRRAQRGAWFPLVLLGLVAAGAAPFYRVGPRPDAVCTAVGAGGGGGGVPAGPGAGVVKCFVVFGWPAFFYWVAAGAGAYVVIAGFYVVRARRRGVGARAGPYVVAGLAGVALVAVLWLAQRYLGGGSRYPSALVVHGLNPLLAIGLALFVLARAERSRALLVFAAANLAALLAGCYNVGGLLREHGWAVPVAWTFIPRLWAAAAVLLLAGAAFAAAGRGRG
jgi:hypothetical protein